MAVNLVSLAMKFLTPDLMLKMASALGLDKGLAQKAIGAAVPAILSGLISKAAKPDGARSLLDALGKQDSGLLGNLAGMIGGSGQSSLISSGTNALTSLLGGAAVNGLSGAIAKYATVAEGPAKSLLGLLGPIVLGTIGQEQRSAKLDAGGLATLLSGQKDHVAAALPADFTKLLSGTGLTDALKDQLNAATAAMPSARKVEMPARGATGTVMPGAAAVPAAPWWRLPVIAVAALGLGWLLFPSNPPPSVLAPATPPVAQRAIVEGVDVGNAMTSVFDTLRTTLGGIRDTATAQAAMPRLQDAASQLDRVAQLAAKMSPETRKSLAGTVNTGLSSLSPLFSSVLSIPGVAAVAKPSIDAVRAKLDVLAKG